MENVADAGCRAADTWSALEADRPGPTPAPVDLTHEKEGSMPKLDVSGGDGCEAGNTGTEGKSEPVMGSGAAAVATRYRDGQSSVQGACCCCFSSPAPKLDKLGARSMSMRQLLVLCFSMVQDGSAGQGSDYPVAPGAGQAEALLCVLICVHLIVF
ncbi:uncharacterized protein LOC128328567 isoform X8 [Hemicordylus capensis]|uniref:uncharacterized protein LOC128328567 isoform X8 n=1 Tax=Hemicordylus capensis TaxID=884348 RepID=UPI002303B292|nr:uncharacterized protein LOC128328567 isoform X8 [Hemicordylus capensis]